MRNKTTKGLRNFISGGLGLELFTLK